MDGVLTQPPPTPPAKPPSGPTATTIETLGEDILCEIFLRLPSLASLVRAALFCQSWRRAVCSSPAFRRRFRSLHRPPLLGLFFDPPGAGVPTFVLVRPFCFDLVAAAHGGDFLFTCLQKTDDPSPAWEIKDCRDGYILLANWDADEQVLAIVNPMVRGCAAFFPLLPHYIVSEHRGYFVFLGFHLLFSEEDPELLRVVCMFHVESRVRAGVFSFKTGAWCLHLWVEVATGPFGEHHWLGTGMQASGFLYWACKDQEHMMMLNTATMEFSVTELPAGLKGQGHSFVVGETKDG